MNSAENVRVEVEIEERSDDGSQGSEEHFGLREESKNRLKRLGKLYGGNIDIDCCFKDIVILGIPLFRRGRS